MPTTPEQRLLDESPRTRPAVGHPSPGLVVLGVDGSTRNRPAVAWATREAREAGLGLLVVAVLPRSDVTPPRQPAWVQERVLIRAALVEDRVRRPDRPFRRAFRLASGIPGPELARSARPGDVVVVGRRGGGSLQRLRVGSTSLSAATFVRVPLVVVPDDWDQARQSAGHLLVGVDGSGRRGRDGPALDFAFARAARLGVPLLVFSGWELPPLHRWSAADASAWAREQETRLGRLLAPWLQRFPRVRAGVRAETTAPAAGLLHAAHGAQLVIVGRGTRRGALERLSLGSTARRVLQQATCPVAVVPFVASAFSSQQAHHHNAQEFVA